MICRTVSHPVQKSKAVSLHEIQSDSCLELGGSQPGHRFLRKYLDSGKVRSVIDRTYPLDQTATTIAYVECGHVRGKVVVTPAAAHRVDGLTRV